MDTKAYGTKTMRTVVALVCMFSAIGSAKAFDQERAKSQDGEGCQRIEARLATATVAENCPSPVGLCAAGVVSRNALIRGTTFANVLGLAPSAGLAGIIPETTLSLAGERTISASQGTLSFRFATIFDTAKGEFAEINTVTGGTERFAGATGTLWITGSGTTVFEGQVTGQICTNRR